MPHTDARKHLPARVLLILVCVLVGGAFLSADFSLQRLRASARGSALEVVWGTLTHMQRFVFADVWLPLRANTTLRPGDHVFADIFNGTARGTPPPTPVVHTRCVSIAPTPRRLWCMRSASTVMPLDLFTGAPLWVTPQHVSAFADALIALEHGDTDFLCLATADGAMLAACPAAGSSCSFALLAQPASTFTTCELTAVGTTIIATLGGRGIVRIARVDMSGATPPTQVQLPAGAARVSFAPDTASAVVQLANGSAAAAVLDGAVLRPQRVLPLGVGPSRLFTLTAASTVAVVAGNMVWQLAAHGPTLRPIVHALTGSCDDAQATGVVALGAEGAFGVAVLCPGTGSRSLFRLQLSQRRNIIELHATLPTGSRGQLSADVEPTKLALSAVSSIVVVARSSVASLVPLDARWRRVGTAADVGARHVHARLLIDPRSPP